MLTDKTKKISAETQAVKQELHTAIVSQIPLEDTVIPWFKIIQYSQLERGILCAAYYNTGSQLRKLSDYVVESSERSLESILKTFQSVVRFGRADAFPKVMFNDATRNIIQALL